MKSTPLSDVPFDGIYYADVLSDKNILHIPGEHISDEERGCKISPDSVCNGPLEVRFRTGPKGKGLFAAKDFAAGDVLFKETPLMSTQDTVNKISVELCGFCLRFLGSFERQMMLLTGGLSYDDGVDGADGHCSPCRTIDEAWNHLARSIDDAHASSTLEDGDGSSLASLLDTLSRRLSVEDRCLRRMPSDGDRLRGSTLNFPVPCSGGCAELYCSEACRDAAWEKYHSMLCWRTRHPDAEAHALYRFSRHALQSNDAFHLVARIIASILLQSTAECSEPDELSKGAMMPYEMLVKRPWWEVKIPMMMTTMSEDEEDGSEDEVELPDPEEWELELRTDVEEAVGLLREAWPRYADSPALSVEFFSSLAGMLEMNSLYVVVPSPLRGLVKDILGHSGEMKHDVIDAAERLVSNMETLQRETMMDGDEEEDEEVEASKGVEDENSDVADGIGSECADDALDGKGSEGADDALKRNHTETREDEDEMDDALCDIFPDGEGTGVYRVQALINHSCTPNVFLYKRAVDNDHRVICVATRPISSGEELFISYIDEDDPVEERQAMLKKPYMFECDCPKCLEEQGG